MILKRGDVYYIPILLSRECQPAATFSLFSIYKTSVSLLLHLSKNFRKVNVKSTVIDSSDVLGRCRSRGRWR